MTAKFKECFAPHVLMHSLFGLGLGIIVVALWPDLGVWWYGLVLIVVAMVMDMMRK